MNLDTRKPVIFLAFANDQENGNRYLRKLRNEAEQLRDLLEGVEACEVVMWQNASLKNILDVFQNPKYKHRIAVFHFGGHANSYQLLLESPEGKAIAADAGGLATFLAQQNGLQLVFLNGCDTHGQVQGLIETGIPAVIVTASKIADRVAVDFAYRFYKGLMADQPLLKAFNEAEGSLHSALGGARRDAYIEGEEFTVALEVTPD